MNYQELEKNVLDWADDKGILDKGNPLAQAKKTLEEVNELIEAVTHQQKGNKTFVNSKGKLVNTKDEIIDAIGDVLVTIIIGAELQGLQLENCLQSAYDVISKRTGVMKDGQFVKNND